MGISTNGDCNLGSKVADPIRKPRYYTKWQVEPSIFMFINNVPFMEGCVIKYVLRWRDKGGIEDLHKAKRYLEMMIEMEANREDYIPNKISLGGDYE